MLARVRQRLLRDPVDRLADGPLDRCRILEAKSYNDAIKAGQFRPFEADGHIVICSYQFVFAKRHLVQRVNWDLVVIDEAHRLCSIYKGTKRETYSCAPACNPALVAGDDNKYFGEVKTGFEGKTKFSDTAAEAAGGGTN